MTCSAKHDPALKKLFRSEGQDGRKVASLGHFDGPADPDHYNQNCSDGNLGSDSDFISADTLGTAKIAREALRTRRLARD